MSYKKTAPRYGRREAGKAVNTLHNNIIYDSQKSKSLPAWVKSKLAKIVKLEMKYHPDWTIEKAIQELVYTGFLELGAELKGYPDLAMSVPEGFRQLFKHNSVSAINDIETAAIILIQFDSKRCLKALNVDNDLLEFLHLKWETLGLLLEGGIYE